MALELHFQSQEVGYDNHKQGHLTELHKLSRNQTRMPTLSFLFTICIDHHLQQQSDETLKNIKSVFMQMI